jgi:hypothetical protein
MLIVPDLRADTHGDLMSVIEAVAAETAATNAAVAAAATAAAAEAAAASKAAAAHDRRQNRYRGERAARPRRAHALDARTPSTRARPRKARHAERTRRRRGTHERRGLFRGAVFGVRARVRVLAATAPGLLPRLATSCGETKVTAFDPRTREYTGFGAGCWLLLGSAMGPRCAS